MQRRHFIKLSAATSAAMLFSKLTYRPHTEP
ncbi:twin-arginine translocation signal domain-containing protein [Mucilaginibacter sp. UC70_90]